MLPVLEGDPWCRGDPRDIIGIILTCDEKKELTIVCPLGIFKGTFSRKRFDLCPKKLLSQNDVNTDISLSLLEAVSSESASGSQGFIKCNWMQEM